MLNKRDIRKLKLAVELSALEHFLRQLKGIIVVPTGEKSDDLYEEFFKFVMKVDKTVKRKVKQNERKRK